MMRKKVVQKRTSDQSVVYHCGRHLPRLHGAVLFGLSRAEHCISSPTRYWPLMKVRQMTSRVCDPSSHVAEHYKDKCVFFFHLFDYAQHNLLLILILYLTPRTCEPFAAAIFGRNARPGCFGLLGSVAISFTVRGTVSLARLDTSSTFFRTLATKK